MKGLSWRKRGEEISRKLSCVRKGARDRVQNLLWVKHTEVRWRGPGAALIYLLGKSRVKLLLASDRKVINYLSVCHQSDLWGDSESQAHTLSPTHTHTPTVHTLRLPISWLVQAQLPTNLTDTLFYDQCIWIDGRLDFYYSKANIHVFVCWTPDLRTIRVELMD